MNKMMSSYCWYTSVLFLICFIICSTESRYRDKDRDRNRKIGGDKINGGSASAMSSTAFSINLCSRDRDMKLLCYCSPDDFTSTLPALKADCRVLEKDFPENDPTWMAFQQQKSLKHLKFTVQKTGFMDYIPTKTFELLTNLTTIGIEYSQVLIVRSFAFANLPNLEKITLIKNLIEVIDRDAFSNHILLKELNLSHNQITELDRFSFRNLPSLERLDLSANNISTLHEGVFSELGKLLELKLDQNLVSVLTRDVFKGLGNLNSLKLTHNNLNFVGDTVFSELWSLHELELDDNRIERISERALDGLNNLKTLNLRNNRLKKLDNGVLRGVPALLSINLQENNLETLTFYNVQPIMDNLLNSGSELYLTENRFICDCRLLWMFELRNNTKNIDLKESLEEIECWLNDKKQPYKPLSSVNDISVNVIKNRAQLGSNIVNRNTNIGLTGGGGIIATGSSSIHGSSGIGGQKKLYNRKYIVNQNQEIHGINSGGTNGNGNYDNEYYEDDASMLPYEFNIEHNHHQHQLQQQQHQIQQQKQMNGGKIVELFKLRPEDLPCTEELNDATELPLSRESIGMDVRTTLAASSSLSAIYLQQNNNNHIFCSIISLTIQTIGLFVYSKVFYS